MKSLLPGQVWKAYSYHQTTSASISTAAPRTEISSPFLTKFKQRRKKQPASSSRAKTASRQERTTLISDANCVIALRQALVNDRDYHAIIDALGKGFSDLEATVKGTYKGPKGNTPSWVADVDNFKTWKEQKDSSLLWVHGKAGTGQGSIASSIIEALNKTRDQGSIVTSFFCDQSDENRRSLKGLLRLLIRQIIDLNQDLAVHLLTDSRKGKKPGSQQFDAESFSKVPFLWEALQTMAKDLASGSIFIVLYGLEQLSAESLSEFLGLIKDIPVSGLTTDDGSDQPPIKWMLLSRSGRPDIEKALKSKSLEINIDDSENAVHVSDALREDISVRVDELGMPAAMRYFVKRHIHSRAEDNYIYVSLVIQELKNAQISGKTNFSEVRTLLEQFPYGLTEMFEHVRKRVLRPDADGIEYTKEILRCMILAYRAPTLRELAVMADIPFAEKNDLETLKGYIVRCGAFLALRGNEFDESSMTVEWVDVSALEHLEKYAKDDLALDLNDMQHGIIALRCLNYCYRITEDYEAREAAERADEDAPDAPIDDFQQEDNPDESHPTIDPPPEEVPPGEVPPPSPSLDGPDNPDQAEPTHEDALDHVEPIESEPDAPDYDYDYENEAENTTERIIAYAVEYWIEHAKNAPVDVIPEFRTGHPFWKDDSAAREDWWKENVWLHALPGQANISALHVAVIAGFSALVEHLLKWGWEEDLHKEDSLGFQPLFYASSHGNFEIVQILLGAGADPNAVSVEGKIGALYAAAMRGHKDIVECLLDRDAEVNAECEEWGTPLYGAASENETEIMQYLIERGAKVNIVGGWHKRILNQAAYNGNIEGVRMLLEQGAEIDPDDQYAYGSALGASARRGHADVVKLLLSRGWSPNKHMTTYGSFLTAAATYGHLEVVEALVQKEARITVLEQALQASSQNGKAAVVKVILDRTPTLRHQKAFMLAADYGRDEVLKLLFPRGMPQDQLNIALYTASDHEHEETVKLLLEFGADPNAEGAEYVLSPFIVLMILTT